jgi:spore germination protein KA
VNLFKKKNKKDGNNNQTYTEQISVHKNMPLTTENLKTIFGDSGDVVFKEVYINGNEKFSVNLVYIDGMVNTQMVNEFVIKPLIQEQRITEDKNFKQIIEMIEHGFVYSAAHHTRKDINHCINDVITGSVAIMFDKENTAVTFEAKGFDKRSVSEPTAENVKKGSKDVFVETIRVNTASVRRKIKTPNLRIVETTVGRQTITTVAVVYIEGLTNKDIVDEVKKRLDNISISEVITPGEIEEYIIDNNRTPSRRLPLLKDPTSSVPASCREGWV